MLTLLTVLLFVFQVFIFIIPIIYKQDYSKAEEKKQMFTDGTAIGLSIIGLGLSIAIFLTNQQAEKDKENQNNNFQIELRNKLAERDSIHSREDSMQTIYFVNRLDSSYTKSITSSNEALAKYNLELVDSLNLVTNKINFKSINLPQLSLSSAETGVRGPIYLTKEQDAAELSLKLVSINNVSYNIRLSYMLFVYEQKSNYTNFLLLDSGGLFYDRNILSPERFSTMTIPIKKEFLDLEKITIVIYGTFYSDVKSTNIIEYSDGYNYDLKNDKTISVLGRSNLINLIQKMKERGVIK